MSDNNKNPNKMETQSVQEVRIPKGYKNHMIQTLKWSIQDAKKDKNFEIANQLKKTLDYVIEESKKCITFGELRALNTKVNIAMETEDYSNL